MNYQSDSGGLSRQTTEGFSPDWRASEEDVKRCPHFAHREDAMEHLPETLIYGKLGPLYEKDGKRNITYGGYTAVIRLFYDGNAERWIVTAFGPEDKKEGNPR